MFQNRILCFAGTKEGHSLALLAKDKNYPIDFSVATDYGEEVLDELDGINILKGRLDLDDIIQLINRNKYKIIIDATHPFAVVATENIRNACVVTDTKYYRYLRTSNISDVQELIMVNNIDEGIEYLNKSEEKVLVTTGAKELYKYSNVEDYKNRIFPRVLPCHSSILAAEDAGIPLKNLICMQGPFSKELNMALMKQYNITTMITKDTGTIGGYEEKANCALEGYKVIVIKRPTVEDGLSYEETVGVLKDYYGY